MDQKRKKKKFHVSWVVKIFIITFIIAFFMTIFSETSMSTATITVSFIILFFIFFVGVIFDVIGFAIAAADEKPFHAMASNRIESAKYALLLIKNASVVANICNDVVGDIAGIVSGTAVATIVIQISKQGVSISDFYISVLLGSLVAAMTVSGKAQGKEYALKEAKKIVNWVSIVLYKVDKIFKYKLIKR